MFNRRLSTREKRLLIALGITAILIGGYYFVGGPLFDYFKSSESKTASLSDKMDKLMGIYSQYKNIRDTRSRYQDLISKSGDNVTTLVQQYAANNNIDKNIAYTRSTQTNIQNKYVRITTDVRLDGVSIQNLIKFLYDVENSEILLSITYLSITKGLKGTDKYDCMIKINSYTQK